MPERMPKMSKGMPDRMSENMSDCTDRMPDGMSENMSARTPDGMSDNMSARMQASRTRFVVSKAPAPAAQWEPLQHALVVAVVGWTRHCNPKGNQICIVTRGK